MGLSAELVCGVLLPQCWEVKAPGSSRVCLTDALRCVLFKIYLFWKAFGDVDIVDIVWSKTYWLLVSPLYHFPNPFPLMFPVPVYMIVSSLKRGPVLSVQQTPCTLMVHINRQTIFNTLPILMPQNLDSVKRNQIFKIKNNRTSRCI